MSGDAKLFEFTRIDNRYSRLGGTRAGSHRFNLFDNIRTLVPSLQKRNKSKYFEEPPKVNKQKQKHKSANGTRHCHNKKVTEMTLTSKTLPKTTCFPSNHDVFTVVIKNWDPFVPGPAVMGWTATIVLQQSSFRNQASTKLGWVFEDFNKNRNAFICIHARKGFEQYGRIRLVRYVPLAMLK